MLKTHKKTKKNMTLQAVLNSYSILKVENLKVCVKKNTFSYCKQLCRDQNNEHTTCYWLWNENKKKTAKTYAYILFIELKTIFSRNIQAKNPLYLNKYVT